MSDPLLKFVLTDGPERGRITLAARQFKTGDTLLTGTTAVSAFDSRDQVENLCSLCCIRLVSVGKKLRCTACKALYYCSERCQKRHWKRIHALECSILAQANGAIPSGRALQLLRAALLLKRSSRVDDGDPTSVTGVPSLADMHTPKDHAGPATLSEEGQVIAAGVARMTGLPAPWMRTLLLKISVNAVELEDSDFRSCGTFVDPTLARLNHSCDPNAAVYFSPGGHFNLRALRPIAQDQEVNITYIHLDQPCKRRLVTLSQLYNFRCACDRCRRWPSLSTVMDICTECFLCGSCGRVWGPSRTPGTPAACERCGWAPPAVLVGYIEKSSYSWRDSSDFPTHKLSNLQCLLDDILRLKIYPSHAPQLTPVHKALAHIHLTLASTTGGDLALDHYCRAFAHELAVLVPMRLSGGGRVVGTGGQGVLDGSHTVSVFRAGQLGVTLSHTLPPPHPLLDHLALSLYLLVAAAILAHLFLTPNHPLAKLTYAKATEFIADIHAHPRARTLAQAASHVLHHLDGLQDDDDDEVVKWQAAEREFVEKVVGSKDAAGLLRAGFDVEEEVGGTVFTRFARLVGPAVDRAAARWAIVKPTRERCDMLAHHHANE